MKIGIFTDTYFPQVSGVATSVKTLKEELERRGHQVYIFTTSDPKADEYEENIYRLPSIPLISFKERRVAFRGLVPTIQKAKKLKLDIVHTQTEFGVGWVGKFVAYNLKIPCVHTYHTMYEDYLHYIAKGKLLKPTHVRMITRAFCSRVVGVIAPSNRVVEQLEKYDIYKPTAIIPTGVNLNEFKPSEQRHIRQELGLSEEQPVILSLSRLSQEKNIEAIIQAMPILVREKPDLILVVVGEGPQRAVLENLVDQLDVTQSVIFVGEKKNEEVGHYYRMADLFVSASESESQGLTYIEALASHTRCLAKESPYTKSLLSDPSLGTTFKTDDVLAAGVLEVLNTPIGETDEQILNEVLYQISSTCFGAKVEEFYYKSIERYELNKKDKIKPIKR
ncbi:glycosyltransferase family 4 protein [Isobaculum melis]|uniref:1,2-diacylglycerol 3-glucosyltransferase n=1 Tax=Isobaculum melis TaxID=142588 RepID=A0A1H9T8C2_9LACT|nr:glycosyltransferase family 4 protein [Isobaculum melis]SER93376.1 1,2-diacylglycerol 3-glucosyltransferase [Isobaculum melis]